MLRGAADEELSEEERLHQLKEDARLYYSEKQVPQRIQQILNNVLYEKPTDVYGRLSEFFEEFQLVPKVESLKAEVILDSNGNFAVRGKLYSTVKNHLQVLASAEISLEKEKSYRNKPHVFTPAAEGASGESGHKGTVTPVDMTPVEPDNNHHEVCCQILQDVITPATSEISIFKQRNIDQAIRSCIDETESKMLMADDEAKKAELEEFAERHGAMTPRSPSQSKKTKNSAKSDKVAKGKPKKGQQEKRCENTEPRENKNAELRMKGCSAGCLASLIVLKAASSFTNQEPYEVIMKLKSEDEKDHFVLPIPIVSVLAAGATTPGKVNFIKNLLIIGNPQFTVKENVERISKTYSALNKLLSVKTPAAMAPNGAFLSSMDKFDAVIHSVTEAITNGGSIPGQDLFIGIEVDSEEIYCADKEKYEIQNGQMKTVKEMTEFYNELVTRFAPSLIMILDPFRKEDIAELLSLSVLVSSRCFVAASEMMLHSAHSWKQRDIGDEVNIFQSNCCNGLALSLGGSITCSDITSAVVKAEESHNITIIQSSGSEVCEDIITDLAVGVEATFLRVGAPCRGENVSRLNRLIEIENQLASDKNVSLAYDEEFDFKVIEVTVEETIENDDTVSN